MEKQIHVTGSVEFYGPVPPAWRVPTEERGDAQTLCARASGQGLQGVRSQEKGRSWGRGISIF